MTSQFRPVVCALRRRAPQCFRLTSRPVARDIDNFDRWTVSRDPPHGCHRRVCGARHCSGLSLPGATAVSQEVAPHGAVGIEMRVLERVRRSHAPSAISIPTQRCLSAYSCMSRKQVSSHGEERSATSAGARSS